MASSSLWAGIAAGLAVVSVGCRQEMPEPPPTPTTSAAPAPSPVMSPTAAAPASTPGAGALTAKSAEDAIITGKVKAELLKATDGKGIEIDVETQNGVVRLSGYAPSNGDIASALEVAKRVEGVKDVQHKLAVRQS